MLYKWLQIFCVNWAWHVWWIMLNYCTEFRDIYFQCRVTYAHWNLYHEIHVIYFVYVRTIHGNNILHSLNVEQNNVIFTHFISCPVFNPHDDMFSIICIYIYLYYLPKFTILASMFVCRFVTCQNFQFLQVCSFVGLSVCLSVLSSITHERFDISSPNLVHIWNGWAVPVCDKVSLLYSCLNEISAFSCIIHERFDKSSLNWIHICTGSLGPASYLDN